MAAAVTYLKTECLINIAFHLLIIVVPVVSEDNIVEDGRLDDLVEEQVRVHIRAVLLPQLVCKAEQLLHVLVQSHYCVLQQFFD